MPSRTTKATGIEINDYEGNRISGTSWDEVSGDGWGLIAELWSFSNNPRSYHPIFVVTVLALKSKGRTRSVPQGLRLRAVVLAYTLQLRCRHTLCSAGFAVERGSLQAAPRPRSELRWQSSRLTWFKLLAWAQSTHRAPRPPLTHGNLWTVCISDIHVHFISGNIHLHNTYWSEVSFWGPLDSRMKQTAWNCLDFEKETTVGWGTTVTVPALAMVC